jgi:hypothetical protein
MRSICNQRSMRTPERRKQHRPGLEPWESDTRRNRPESTSSPLRGRNSEKAQYSDTPVLQHSARKKSRTARPTKPKLYSADRSSRPRKRGALHNQDVGEVGRTTTRTRTKRLTSGDRGAWSGTAVLIPPIALTSGATFRARVSV